MFTNYQFAKRGNVSDLTGRIYKASSKLLFFRDFLDRYNRYTKHQDTFPKEQESRNEFLAILNYNPFTVTHTHTRAHAHTHKHTLLLTFLSGINY